MSLYHTHTLLYPPPASRVLPPLSFFSLNLSRRGKSFSLSLRPGLKGFTVRKCANVKCVNVKHDCSHRVHLLRDLDHQQRTNSLELASHNSHLHISFSPTVNGTVKALALLKATEGKELTQHPLEYQVPAGFCTLNWHLLVDTFPPSSSLQTGLHTHTRTNTHTHR